MKWSLTKSVGSWEERSAQHAASDLERGSPTVSPLSSCARDLETSPSDTVSVFLP